MFPRLLASRGVLLIYIVHTLGITALIASEYISHAITAAILNLGNRQ